MHHLPGGVTDHDVLGAVLDHADRAPARPAVKDLDRELTRGELRAAAGRVGAGLLQKGVEPGDRVGLLIGNSVDFVVAALGCLWAGATFVPLAITDPDLRRAQIVADCRPAQVITAGSDQTAPSGLPVGTAWTTLSALSVADGRTPPPVTGRISYIIYTSGTTGVPKGVQISPTAFFTAVEACADAVGLTADDRCLCVSPVHFDGSFSAIFPPLVRQCRTDFPYEVRIAETMIASDAQIFASLRDGDRHHQSLPDSMIKDFLHAVRKKPNS